VTGQHYWFVKRLGQDANKWPTWVFVRFEEDEPKYVPDHLQATPFRTRDEAEIAAFNLTAHDPTLMQKFKVELV